MSIFTIFKKSKINNFIAVIRKLKLNQVQDDIDGCQKLLNCLNEYYNKCSNKSKFKKWYDTLKLKTVKLVDLTSQLKFLIKLSSADIPSSRSAWNKKCHEALSTKIDDIRSSLKRKRTTKDDESGLKGTTADSSFMYAIYNLTKSLRGEGHLKENLEELSKLKDMSNSEKKIHDKLFGILKNTNEKNEKSIYKRMYKKLTNLKKIIDTLSLDHNDRFGIFLEQLKINSDYQLMWIHNLLNNENQDDKEYQAQNEIEESVSGENIENSGYDTDQEIGSLIDRKTRKWRFNKKAGKFWPKLQKVAVGITTLEELINKVNKNTQIILPKLYDLKENKKSELEKKFRNKKGKEEKIKKELDKITADDLDLKDDEKITIKDLHNSALSCIGGLATYVRDTLRKVKKEKGKAPKLDMSDASHFKKSEKLRILSLLIQYVFTYINKIDYEHIYIKYSGAQGIFVEVTSKSEKPRYFKLTKIDQEIGDKFTREVKDKSNRPVNVHDVVNDIKNLSLYTKVTHAGEGSVAEVEYHKSTTIKSLTNLINRAITVCKVLQNLHQKGLNHNDFKFDNAVYSEEGTYVIDVDDIKEFGIHEGNASWRNRNLANIAGNLNPKHFGRVLNDQKKDMYAFGKTIYKWLEDLIKLKKDEINKNDSRIKKLKNIAKYCLSSKPPKDDDKLIATKALEKLEEL